MKKVVFLLMLFGFGVTDLMAQNAPPTISTYETNVLCPDGGNQTAVSNIIFDDADGDSVYITDVITLGTGTTLVSTPDYTNGLPQAGSSVTLETISGGSTGVFDIRVEYDDGYAYYVSDTISISIAPRINIVLDSIGVCENVLEVDLNELVNVQGGRFYIPLLESYSPPNGIVNMDVFDDYQPISDFNFSYDIQDEYGCLHYSQDNGKVTLNPAPEITLEQVSNTNCNDTTGSISTFVDSPNGGYDSYWNNGSQNTDNISNLTAGDYYYQVIDNTGCTDQIAAIVQSSGLYINGTTKEVTCFGESNGEIHINITGGSGDYSMIWSSGHSSEDVSGLSAGSYQVTVTDLDDGCQTTQFFNVSEPELPFSVYYLRNNNTCNNADGFIHSFSASGGYTPYTFNWSNGATTDTITNLSSGIYSVTVTDSLGCTATKSLTLKASGAPYISWDVISTKCGESSGRISLNTVDPAVGEQITGYSWSTGAVTRNLYDLSEGTYTCTVSQSNGCDAISEYTVRKTNFNYAPSICIVTVDTATNTNLVVWEKQMSNPNDIDYYKIYRATANTGEYQFIDSVDYDSISVFNDVVVSPERKSWLYKIAAVNNCGQESRLSPHHKTIHLVMNDGPIPGVKKITWDHYEGLEYFYYDLYRGTDVDGWNLVQDNIPITTLPDFTDSLPAGATEVDYIVEVVPNGGGCSATLGKAQDYNSSRSNKPSPIFAPGKGTGDPNNGLDVYENNEFKALVYPNPSTGDFQIEITENIKQQDLKMRVMGVDGKVYHNQALKNNLNTVQLDVDAGVYIVQIQGENTLETIRIVVQ